MPRECEYLTSQGRPLVNVLMGDTLPLRFESFAVAILRPVSRLLLENHTPLLVQGIEVACGLFEIHPGVQVVDPHVIFDRREE